MKKLAILLITVAAAALAIAFYIGWERSERAGVVNARGLLEVDNGDAQFWLMQGGANNRYLPCTVHYYFDQPLDESLVLNRLKDLVAPYQMFKRNVVEVDGLPYWQPAKPDWRQNFRRLSAEENMTSVRVTADRALSQVQEVGAGVPLFRAFLSNDGRQLTFMWHHVISDFEGMFNKHARHLFQVDIERTRFGYQIENPGRAEQADDATSPLLRLNKAFAERPLGFEQTGFDVRKFVLPIEDKALHDRGRTMGLPMSDIFSFITMRTVTLYHESKQDGMQSSLRPVVSPLSLRKSSLATDEGNNRVTKPFPLVFPLESVEVMYQRILSLAPASGSYDRAGRMLKVARQFSFLEAPMRRLGSPDYISNYFPLADMPLRMEDAVVTSHELRVPMVPYERTKFAWSNYNGEVQLFLHTDPKLVDADLMAASYAHAEEEVLSFLGGSQ
jgi:hypothetical protein